MRLFDKFLILFFVFIIANIIGIIKSYFCNELGTVFLLLFIIPFVSVFAVILNLLYVKYHFIFFQIVRYANFVLIVIIMWYYWFKYNTCKRPPDWGKSVSSAQIAK